MFCDCKSTTRAARITWAKTITSSTLSHCVLYVYEPTVHLFVLSALPCSALLWQFGPFFFVLALVVCLSRHDCIHSHLGACVFLSHQSPYHLTIRHFTNLVIIGALCFGTAQLVTAQLSTSTSISISISISNLRPSSHPCTLLIHFTLAFSIFQLTALHMSATARC